MLSYKKATCLWFLKAPPLLFFFFGSQNIITRLDQKIIPIQKVEKSSVGMKVLHRRDKIKTRRSSNYLHTKYMTKKNICD